MNTNESDVKSKLILTKNLHFNITQLNLLELFVNEVLNYNKRYNLISQSSEKEIWNRHVLDSAQLVKFIEPHQGGSIADLGTGAGFPGIVLSIFFNDFSKFHVKLYEKSKIKVKFIKNIIKKARLQNIEIYDNDYQSHKINSSYIVSRAFKKLPEMIRISRETAQRPHKMIIMMGKSAQEELNKASKGLIFKYKLESSITQSDSKILLVDAKN